LNASVCPEWSFMLNELFAELNLLLINSNSTRCPLLWFLSHTRPRMFLIRTSLGQTFLNYSVSCQEFTCIGVFGPLTVCTGRDVRFLWGYFYRLQICRDTSNSSHLFAYNFWRVWFIPKNDLILQMCHASRAQLHPQ
jgi:hypothetical protein